MSNQRQAQQETGRSLTESDTRLQELLDNLPGVVYRCHNDRDWTMVVLSDWVEDLCGYAASDFIQSRERTWASLIHPEDEDGVATAVEAAIADCRPYELEYRIWHRDGTVRWIYEKGQGSFGVDGDLQYLNGVMLDITARKEIEARLQQSEATNRALIQAIPDLLLRMGADGTYRDLVANPGLNLIPLDLDTEGAEPEIAATLPSDFIHNRLHYAAQALATGTVQIYQQALRIGAGTRYEEVRITPCGVDEVLVMVRDISEQQAAFLNLKQTEEQLQQLNAELEQRVAIRTQQLQASQHKLLMMIQQTPLAVIEWDTDNCVQAWNPAAESMFGYSAPEAMGRKANFLMPLELQVQVDELLGSLQQQQQGIRTTNITRNGKLLTCDWYSTALTNGAGQVIGVASLILDITEQQAATEALRQREIQMRRHQGCISHLVRDRVSEKLSFEKFVARLLETAAHALHCNVGLWMIADDQLQCRDYYSPSTGHSILESLPLGALSNYLTILASGRTIATADIATDPRTQEVSAIYGPTTDVLALMDTALWFQGEMVGILCFESSGKAARPWTLEEISFADSLADLLTSEIEAWQRRQAELALKKSELALRAKATELQRTLDELQRTQAQVIQSEKMSSLGQLVAGVAHEINNPVNFIYGNLSHAHTYTTDLLDLIDLYQQTYPEPSAEILTQTEVIDLPFVAVDLPKLLDSMKVGADRIQEIVASLRTFSRMDEAEMKAVDIHAGIDSTLMILQHRIKAKSDRVEINLQCEYDDLPPVECYAGQLNQVFMNLLSNAVDALEEGLESHSLTEPPKITVTTTLVDGNQVKIAIADNGPGIPDTLKAKIFNPFFTTKPIGKGTGMGLSISYQIVTEKHNGTLTCLTPATGGTRFEITIPLQQPEISITT